MRTRGRFQQHKDLQVQQHAQLPKLKEGVHDITGHCLQLFALPQHLLLSLISTAPHTMLVAANWRQAFPAVSFTSFWNDFSH